MLRLNPPVIVLLLCACDPVGVLRVIVVSDGAGPDRQPLPDATVSVRTTVPPQYSGGARGTEGPVEPLDRHGPSGEFRTSRIPTLFSGAVITVEHKGFQSRSYRLGDVCVRPRNLSECDEAFLYAPLTPSSDTEGK
jgi:hypothetical protein